MQQENIKIGDVLIKGNNLSSIKWALARVTKIHPDNNGTVQVVSLVKSGGANFKRPVHKLIPLLTDKQK